MSDTRSIRRWVYDPQSDAWPIWVIRKFHKIGPGRLSSVKFGDAYPGDTICMDVAFGRYWVEKPKASKSMRGVKEDHRGPRGGWADGEYLCKCGFCACQFFGDKRAVQCADCAYGQEAAK